MDSFELSIERFARSMCSAIRLVVLLVILSHFFGLRLNRAELMSVPRERSLDQPFQ